MVTILNELYQALHFFNPMKYIFTSITLLPQGNGSVVFDKVFHGEFLPDLYVFRSPEPKKVVFRNWSVRMYACM